MNIVKHTIDGDGNRLGESVAIGADESGDLANGVDLAVLNAGVESSSSFSLSLDQLQVQVVVLGSNQDGDGATVVLKGVNLGQKEEEMRMNIQEDRKACRRSS